MDPRRSAGTWRKGHIEVTAVAEPGQLEWLQRRSRFVAVPKEAPSEAEVALWDLHRDGSSTVAEVGAADWRLVGRMAAQAMPTSVLVLSPVSTRLVPAPERPTWPMRLTPSHPTPPPRTLFAPHLPCPRRRRSSYWAWKSSGRGRLQEGAHRSGMVPVVFRRRDPDRARRYPSPASRPSGGRTGWWEKAWKVDQKRAKGSGYEARAGSGTGRVMGH